MKFCQYFQKETAKHSKLCAVFAYILIFTTKSQQTTIINNVDPGVNFVRCNKLYTEIFL